MLKLYHSPQTRSSRMVWLLEEIGAPYEIEYLDIRAEGGLPESYRAIHPLKKVPALQHDGEIVTESAAICLYLSDAFPAAGLGPRVGEAGRGAYLSWLAYYAGVVEPALMVKAVGATGFSPLSAAWGDPELMIKRLEDTLSAGPYVLGERFTTVDVLIGSTFQWAGRLLPKTEAVEAYKSRLMSRPAFLRSLEKDAA
ncbi:glutathione S-transferase family protein [Caulobacter sp. S45]|uniref:glutathione S-transferase family protein n=1 Tax=Caulobacter sp. S45 TaxID=1641861 RepID=UPI001576B939|nr:glutathione S-transferase family protein [Caulobacter sp. S45]